MPIRPYQPEDGILDVDYYPAGNLYTSGTTLQGAYKAGDLVGLIGSGPDAARDNSPVGAITRRNNNQGQAAGATSFPLVAAGGILGFVKDDLQVDASGIVTSPSVPTGVNPQVAPIYAVPSRTAVLSAAPAIAGVVRTNLAVWLATDGAVFIQRHKKGTRVNQSLVGQVANLTWNTTTLEFEVDTTGGATNTVVIVEIPAFYGDNRTWYDSATFATDAYGAWVAFRVLPAWQAWNLGLRYVGNT